MHRDFTSYLSHPVFKVIKKYLEDNEGSAFVIGGFVRDLLLEKKSKDIDIVVYGDGLQFAKNVAEILRVKKVSVFKTFGTAHFRYKDVDVEFVTARKESYSKDSRNPKVSPGSLKDDQYRRDFTINALAIDLHPSSFGELIDPFNGETDIENGMIRTPLDPSETFSDDPLRMLRAIRFASQLDFKIDISCLKSIRDQSERIKIISRERITDEINKILMSPCPSRGFKLLKSTGLLEYIFPELLELSGIETINGKSHKDNFLHTLQVVDNVSKTSDKLWLRWSALLHDIAKPPTKRFDKKIGWTFHGHEELGSKMVPRIFKYHRLPLDAKMKYVQKLVRLHLRPIALVKGSVTDTAIRRLLNEAGEDVEDLMLLCNADITSKNEFKVKRYQENFKLVSEKLQAVEEKDKIRNFQPPVKGEEIMKSFNLGPCYEVGVIKSKIKEAILEGEIPNSYDDAKALMLTIGKEMGLEIKESLN
ncbi:MAG: HD domain-containing protein [Flavobacteriales bacterium]|jgi:poly(A) polymerase|nr:HD domain-containing protein [Flavobacteriales bacterium]MDC3308713.1 CCA tRNA nucleotidyltransferase [Crocinitomicaceae bacterium]MDO7610667.1 CCA tRNA nucleotidyltransferase [Crocinitomicaceae bacterium]